MQNNICEEGLYEGSGFELRLAWGVLLDVRSIVLPKIWCFSNRKWTFRIHKVMGLNISLMPQRTLKIARSGHKQTNNQSCKVYFYFLGSRGLTFIDNNGNWKPNTWTQNHLQILCLRCPGFLKNTESLKWTKTQFVNTGKWGSDPHKLHNRRLRTPSQRCKDKGNSFLPFNIFNLKLSLGSECLKYY